MYRQTEMERKCAWRHKKGSEGVWQGVPGSRHGASSVLSVRTSGDITLVPESQAGPAAWAPRLHRIKKLRERLLPRGRALHARPRAKGTTAW